MAREPESYFLDEIFEVGIGEVAVCRYKSGGRVEAGIFLVDVFCLGVKDAAYLVFESEESFRNEFLNPQLPGAEARPGAWGRKLVEEAVKYAGSLGFSPHSDYKKGARVFGGINASDCEAEFVFGRNGRPFFLQGPYESSTQIDRIHAVLTARLGEDGYDFEELSPDEEDAYEEGEVIDSAVLADSHANSESPSPAVLDVVEDLRVQMNIAGEVIYGGPSFSPIAEALRQAAATCYQNMLSASETSMTLDDVTCVLIMRWNFMGLPEEERKIALAELPPEVSEIFHSESLPPREDSDSDTAYPVILCHHYFTDPETGIERLLLILPTEA